MNGTKVEDVPGSMSPLSVLILEDDPCDTSRVMAQLESAGYGVQMAVSQRQQSFREQLRAADYDVILTDFCLRNWTALDALDILKHSGKEIPVIVVTNPLGEETAVECMKRGATDYVLKNRLALLPDAVRRAREVRALAKERERAGQVRHESQALMKALAEHQRVQEELRRSQEELQSILASVPDYLWSAYIDSQGHMTYQYYSPVVEKITGRPPEFFMPGPERWLSTIHPDDRPRFQTAVESIRTGQLPQMTEEYRIVRPDGTARWVRDRVQIRRQNGHIRIDGVVSDITERHQAEEALHQSEAQLRDALRDAQMGVWKWTWATDTVTWDENLYCIAGRNPKLPAPANRDTPQILTRDSWERVKAAGENALATGTPFEVDLELIRPDGTKRWLIGRGAPLRDGSGNVTQLQGTLQDITDRKRAEEALRESEERFRATFENAGIGMALVDMQGHPFKSNPALRQMLGYSEEEFSRMAVMDFTHPDDRDLDREIFGELVAGKRDRYEIEKRYLKKGGGVVSGMLIISLVKDVRGRPMYTVGMIEDLTEYKRAEEALRRSDQRYKDFISHSTEGVWRMDLEQPIPADLPGEEILARILRYGYLAECNLAHAQNFGLGTVEEAIGKHLRDLVPPSAQERTEPFRSGAGGQWQSRTVEFRGHDKCGNFKHWLTTEIPIVENGMLIHIWGITRDVSELKWAEEERQRSLEQLRALAARLQSIREEERKRVAREIHDQLGQALTAIKIDLSSLVRELPAGNKHCLKRTSSILQLVEESIRVVRRISTELRPGILDDLGLVAAIEWAGENFQARTGTTCRLDLPQDDITIDSERATAVFRIFQETLTNVARHADASKVEVRLTAEDAGLTLEVRDNGRGITEDKLLASDSLGILGMRERAMLLGGELSIKAPPGSGTTVKVRIPDARHK